VGGAADDAAGQLALFNTQAQGTVLAEREIAVGGGAAALGETGAAAGVAGGALGGADIAAGGLAATLGTLAIPAALLLGAKLLGDSMQRATNRENATAIQAIAESFVESGGSAQLFGRDVDHVTDALKTAENVTSRYSHRLGENSQAVKAAITPSQQFGQMLIGLGKDFQEGGALQFAAVLHDDLLPALSSGKLGARRLPRRSRFRRRGVRHRGPGTAELPRHPARHWPPPSPDTRSIRTN
jgi:hypothetical protein